MTATKRRHLAIGDIHGCATALDTLLEYVAPATEDVVVTLGDYIDRGPDSRRVIDCLMSLAGRCNHVALRGNHEIMMLDAMASESWLRPWLGHGGKATLESYGGAFENIPDDHLDFLKNRLQPMYENKTHFFVHANARPDIALDQQPDAALYWQKFGDPGPHLSGKTMVCGHTEQRSGLPVSNDHAVCIDTKAYASDGWLTCLDIELGRIWQANESGAIRDGSIWD